ncbi:hypothetical protein [Legionella fallonii]|uniref:Uncharacterized protein n=1 Tax=Legionella fallonii LLAP-10 TaxID=1212491 RepID=A0A098G074_9GAMM|nr:hypothetical protein [Legionella fallonii]CEG55897.1 protein of unknown function [Legionella fallonii LLAP-10]
MDISEIKEEMQRLSNEFKKYESALKGMQVGEIKKNKELMKLFTSLYHLMQSSLFYEALLDEGFAKTTTNYAAIWNFTSPILSLLGAFYRIFCVLVSDHYVYSVGYDFSCQEKEWIGSVADLDVHLSNLLVNRCKNEAFLGLYSIDLQGEPDKKQYENLIKRLRGNSSRKMTAIVYASDGTYTEPLFFIKDEEKIEVLVATNYWGSASHIHGFTKTLINKYKIKCTISPQIKVVHDGNCSVQSELNINTVLYEALQQNNSVYRVIDALRKEECSLSDYRVHLSDVSPNNNSQDKPDFSTLARLLTKASAVFLRIGGRGWIDYCRARAIHPKNIVKTSYNEWESLQYPNWLSTRVFPPYEYRAVIPQSKIDTDSTVLPLIAKDYAEKLTGCGALGAKILQQIERLQLHQDSCNPYWINSKKKSDAIINALNQLDFEDENTLRAAVTNPESELYHALNLQRLSLLTFLGAFGWNQAKSLQCVQEVAQSVTLKI